MKHKFLLFIFLLLAVAGNIRAQNSLVKQWDVRFGGTKWQETQGFQQTTDGGYIIGGRSLSGASADKTQPNWDTTLNSADYWIVKTDSMGQKKWDKTFGGTGDDQLLALQQTADNGYILGGMSISGISGDKTQASRGDYDFWVVKTDSFGNKEWEKTFGGTSSEDLQALQQTSDKGFIIGGTSRSGAGGDKTQNGKGGISDMWVVKTDSLGNKQWDRCYGGDNVDRLYSLHQTTDGGYILGGVSLSTASSDKTQPLFGAPFSDIWIVKIDSAGNKQWDKAFGGTGKDELYSIRQTKDGGYILGGFSYSQINGNKTDSTCNTTSDYWVIKLDISGNIQWQRSYGGSDEERNFTMITPLDDGGYLVAGSSYSTKSCYKNENNFIATTQGWILKIDSIGNKIWDKTILNQSSNLQCYTVVTKDNCYLVATDVGYSPGGYCSKSARGLLGPDYWIVKFRDTTSTSILPGSKFNASDTLLCISEGGNCVNFINLSSNSTSYQWLFPGATPSSDTAANPTNICYASAGTYSVTLKAFNSNFSDSVTKTNYIVIDACLNANELSNNKTIVITPNPSTNKFTVSFSNAISNASLKIFNMMGEEVYSKTVNGKQQTVNTKLSSGIYFVQVRDEERQWVEKIVVE